MDNHQHEIIIETTDFAPDSTATVRIYACATCDEPINGDPDNGDHDCQPIIEEIDFSPDSTATVKIYACCICGETMEGNPDEDRAEYFADMAYDTWRDNQE